MQNVKTKRKLKISRENFCIFLEDLMVFAACLFVNMNMDNSSLIWVPGSLFLIINTLRLWWSSSLKRLADLLIQYRYLLGLIMFIICLIFRIHGSSMGVYDSSYGKIDTEVQSELFGAGREVRSDEYLVQTPYFFSQVYNDFQLESNQMSLSGQNMIIGYNSPVLDPTIIGKPFTLGYLLFGNEVGLSWYWSSRWILYLLIAYEFFKILIQKKYLPALASFCLVFSSAAQWWYTPHMFQVFFWSTLLFVCGYSLFTAKTGIKKFLFSACSISALVGFVISIFPSLQVSCGLLMLVLMIACLIRDREKISWTKKDYLFIAIIVSGAGGVLGNFLIESKDAIKALNNTVYPGHRVYLGGNGNLSTLFLNPGLLFSPYLKPDYLNECEISSFYHFTPLFLIYFPYLYRRVKKSESNTRLLIPGTALSAVLIVCLIFLYIGFPEWLAKVTLFSYMNRIDLVYSFAGQIFTFWSAAMIIKYRKKLQPVSGAFVCLVYLLLSLIIWNQSFDPAFLAFTGKFNMAVILLLMSLAVYTVFTAYSQLFFCFSFCWTILSGLTVNPVVTGAASISNHPLTEAAVSIEKEDPNLIWAAADSLLTQNLLLANGIQVINATNFYPDTEKWELIDPTGDYDDYYNRYIHLVLTLTNEPTAYSQPTADRLDLALDAQDLKKWNVRRLVSQQDYYSVLEEAELEPNLLYEDEVTGQHIYSLNYQ